MLDFYLLSIAFTLIACAASCALLYKVSCGIVVVEQGTCMVIKRLGKFSHVLEPGIHLINPILEQAGAIDWEYTTTSTPSTRIPTSPFQFDIDPVECFTNDQLSCQVDTTIMLRIQDPKVAVCDNIDIMGQIDSLILTSIGRFVCDLSYENLLSHQKSLQAHVLREVNEESKNTGIVMTRLDIQSIGGNEEMKRAIVEVQKRKCESEMKLNSANTERQLAEVAAQAAEQAMRSQLVLEQTQRSERIKAERELQQHQLTQQLEACNTEMQIAKIEQEREAARLRELAVLEAEGLKKLLEANATPEYLAERQAAETMRVMAQSTNTKLVIPYTDLRRFAGMQFINNLLGTDGNQGGGHL